MSLTEEAYGGFVKIMRVHLFILFIALQISIAGFSKETQWSDFKYNSPEEKAFWGTVREWTNILHIPNERRDSNGIIIGRNSPYGFTGYIKTMAGDNRIIFQISDGWVIRLKAYYSNGQNIYVQHWKAGQLHGLHTWWYENGRKMKEVNYRGGKKEGLFTNWYKNGQKEGEANYKDGKEDGIITVWYDNGQKQWEGNFNDGERNGFITEWYDNGQKKKEEKFKNGKEEGVFIEWDKNGQKRSGSI